MGAHWGYRTDASLGKDELRAKQRKARTMGATGREQPGSRFPGGAGRELCPHPPRPSPPRFALALQPPPSRAPRPGPARPSPRLAPPSPPGWPSFLLSPTPRRSLRRLQLSLWRPSRYFVNIFFKFLLCFSKWLRYFTFTLILMCCFPLENIFQEAQNLEGNTASPVKPFAPNTSQVAFFNIFLSCKLAHELSISSCKYC